jgi:hypothetical protein
MGKKRTEITKVKVFLPHHEGEVIDDFSDECFTDELNELDVINHHQHFVEEEQ